MFMASNNGSKPFTDNQLTRLVKESANQVWHVGRGAYSRAGSEGGRLVGNLLSIGGRIDREAKNRVVGARDSATEAWDRLESAFVHRVARALNALQIPTARDVHELNSRVEALQKAVVALERRAAQAGERKPRAKAPARAGARKKTAGRSARKAPARARMKTGS
jgi:poly(hydroxyalkanoate) granule-associated protein